MNAASAALKTPASQPVKEPTHNSRRERTKIAQGKRSAPLGNRPKQTPPPRRGRSNQRKKFAHPRCHPEQSEGPAVSIHRFVSGHDFSRAENAPIKSTGFSPCGSANQSLAPIHSPSPIYAGEITQSATICISFSAPAPTLIVTLDCGQVLRRS